MMSCSDVTPRLVAYQDAELSPSEHQLVAQHLRGCRHCADAERALALVTPKPALVVPAEVHRRMAAALDAAIAAELAQPAVAISPPARGPVARLSRWLGRDTTMSRGTLVAWAAVGAALLGWGLTNYAALQQARATPALADVHVPADQYRPASFSATGSENGWH